MFREPEIIFRAMKEDFDGKPLTGNSSRTLGVRIEGRYADIPINGQGKVHPNTGGMSVAPDTHLKLPKPKLPKSLGGEGRDPVFALQVIDLPDSLSLCRDTPSHALVEPSKSCLLQEFEQNLYGTRRNWVKRYE